MTDRVRTGQCVMIEDERITAVADCGTTPAGATRLDWSAYTVLPGLIDLHTHLADVGQSADLAAPMKASPAETALVGARNARVTLDAGFTSVRSEEHTSELQSLMRISYAVFCLKKKKRTREKPTPQRTTNSCNIRNKR